MYIYNFSKLVNLNKLSGSFFILLVLKHLYLKNIYYYFIYKK